MLLPRLFLIVVVCVSCSSGLLSSSAVKPEILNGTSGVLLDIKRSQFIYLTQGPNAPPKWLCDVGARSDTQVIYASFADELTTTCEGITRALYLPHSSWTVGRNALYAEALKFQQEQGWRAEYLIFTDDDVELHADSKTMDPYSLLHASLGNVQPAVAAIGFAGTFGSPRNKCGPRTPCAPDIDAAFNAFHATAAPILLPYDEEFESKSWGASQAILIELMMASMPEHVVQFNQLSIVNAGHSSYPRSHIWAKPESGFSELALYLRNNVNSCMRENIGLEQIGEGLGCHPCQKTSACEDSDVCLSRDSGSGNSVNYMDVVACKPFMT